MRRRKSPSGYLLATAAIWGTCYEVAANRWLDIRALYKLFIYEGK